MHKTIEATLMLRRENGLSLDRVASMRVDMAPGGTKLLIHPFPQNGLNALFSAPYAVCAALEDGHIDLRSFSDSQVLRPPLQARLRDVTVVESEKQAQGAPNIGNAPVTVTLKLRDGNELTKTVRIAPGAPQDPLTDADLESKWMDCLQHTGSAIDPAQGGELLRAGLSIDSAARVQPWLDSLRMAVRKP